MEPGKRPFYCTKLKEKKTQDINFVNEMTVG